jgi:hypothetical protein
MILSWGVLAWGIAEFCRVALDRQAQELAPSRLVPFGEINFFWIMISPQIFGGLLASKLEIIMTGLLLLATAWLVDSGANTKGTIQGSAAKFWASSAILAWILNWKFQPLPSVGLLLLLWVLVTRNWKWPAALGAWLVGWYALPFAFRPVALLLEAHSVWSRTFSSFVREAWLDFENLFSFLKNSFGLELSFTGSQVFSLLAGASLGAAIFAWFLRQRKHLDEAALLRQGATLALALGSMFTVVFSPLGQNNALILYSPLALGAFLGLTQSSGSPRLLWVITLGGVFTMMTLPYSDLIPLPLRLELRHLALKQPTCLALGAVLLLQTFRPTFRREEMNSQNRRLA